MVYAIAVKPMARSCVCWKTYTCLLCEDIANGLVVLVEGKAKRTNTLNVNRPVAECGTRSGYKRHRANGEEACGECKHAQNEAIKEYNKRKRERANDKASA